MKPLGLYLHIPFCKSKCLYCDFCSFPTPKEDVMAAYIRALCRDLEKRGTECRGYTVDTVYVGGGTPTVLSADLLGKIMNTVTRVYHLSAEAEITAECNPATADFDLLRQMRSMGWNRLSIGLQSAQDGELKSLGRLHSFAQFQKTWDDARTAGFSNLSADVMFGIPKQTEESFLDTLEKVIRCEPTHLSAYALTVEENTPFGRRGANGLNLPNEESVRQMYLDMIAKLDTNGLKQYEISNFSKCGYESKHNLKYWNTDEYLGFGVGAYSDFGGERFGNSRDMKAYLRGEDIVAERELPTCNERLNEYVMLQMRLNKGVSEKELYRRFGRTDAEKLIRAIASYEKGGFVKSTAEGYAFSAEGMLVSNTILSDVLDFG